MELCHMTDEISKLEVCAYKQFYLGENWNPGQDLILHP